MRFDIDNLNTDTRRAALAGLALADAIVAECNGECEPESLVHLPESEAARDALEAYGFALGAITPEREAEDHAEPSTMAAAMIPDDAEDQEDVEEHRRALAEALDA
jgi:hypothetical protein